MAKLCPKGKAAAKRKFDVYPSAYANMYASAVCSGKVKPGGKKKKKTTTKKRKKAAPKRRRRALSAAVKKALSRKAKSSGISARTLGAVYRRGQGAFLSSGSRPGMTMSRWAFARVNSFIRGSRKHDLDLRRRKR